MSAANIDERPVELYLGPCQVMAVDVARGALIGPNDLTAPIIAERLLLATRTFPDPARFNVDFAAVEPAARRVPS